MMNRIASVLILAMFVVGLLISTFNIQPVKARIIVVPDEYSTISKAIFAANSGDIVYVKNGTYYENVVVDKAIMLVGQNRETTIIDAGGMGSVVELWASNATITGFTIRNCGAEHYAGLKLRSVSHCSVSNNNITANQNKAVYLQSSSSNNLSGNAVTGNSGCGIYLDASSNNNSIVGNSITNNRGWYANTHSIYLSESSGNYISQNNIANNSGWQNHGICLYYYSSNNSVSGNTVSNLFDFPTSQKVFGNDIIWNWHYGIVLDSTSINNTIKRNKIANTEDVGILLSGSSGNSVSENSVSNTGSGISLGSSLSNSVSDNSLTANGNGVSLGSSSDNNIVGNNITGNSGDGINLQGSSNNNIVGNNVASNAANGVCFYSSSDNNMMSQNIITKNNVGVYLNVYSSNNTIQRNRIANNSLHGINLYLSSNYNCITGNNVTNHKQYGIWIYESSCNNNITRNIIVDNNRGIYLYHYSNNTTINENKIANNTYGVWLDASSNNIIYHNNFDANLRQALTIESYANLWDDGYPSGGNYWSDYTGVDVKSGPNQDIPGSDGIGDTPYTIVVDNIDKYPLMKPYASLSISIYMDKYNYHGGDTMKLGLAVVNPDGEMQVCLAIWIVRPGGIIYVYMHMHNIALPANVNYNNPAFQTFTLPSITPGIYTWHAALLQPSTHAIIVEDMAEWQFS